MFFRVEAPISPDGAAVDELQKLTGLLNQLHALRELESNLQLLQQLNQSKKSLEMESKDHSTVAVAAVPPQQCFLKAIICVNFLAQYI